MKRLNLNITVTLLIFLSIISRLIAMYFFPDTKLDNEWGKLVHNLEISGILGINVVIDDYTALHKFAESSDVVLPSIFMPPLYVYFIYFVKLFWFFVLVQSVPHTDYELILHPLVVVS